MTFSSRRSAQLQPPRGTATTDGDVVLEVAFRPTTASAASAQTHGDAVHHPVRPRIFRSRSPPRCRTRCRSTEAQADRKATCRRARSRPRSTHPLRSTTRRAASSGALDQGLPQRFCHILQIQNRTDIYDESVDFIIRTDLPGPERLFDTLKSEQMMREYIRRDTQVRAGANRNLFPEYEPLFAFRRCRRDTSCTALKPSRTSSVMVGSTSSSRT